jgi:hypothetical protein
LTNLESKLNFDLLFEDHVNDFNKAMYCIEDAWKMKSDIVVDKMDACIADFETKRESKWRNILENLN